MGPPFYVVIRALWSSRLQGKGSTFILSYFETLSIGPAPGIKHAKLSTRAQLVEGRLALNLGLNLTPVSFSCAQKHFLGLFSLLFLELPIISL